MRWVFLAALAIPLIVQIFVPPIVGLADNGDFVKVIGMWSLGAPAERQYSYISSTLTFDGKYRFWSGFLSSEQAIGWAAVKLGRLYNRWTHSDRTVFDIRWIGGLHLALYLGIWYSAAMLSKHLTRAGTILVAILSCIAFTDFFYAAYFNSFYMDAAALLGLLALAVGLLRMANGIGPRVSAGIAIAGAAFLAASKTQHAPLGILVLAALAVPYFRRELRISRRQALAAAPLILTAVGLSWYGSPDYYRLLTQYDVIFWEILPHSQNPSADLAELGLDDTYKTEIGKYGFRADAGVQLPEFRTAMASRTSYKKIGLFFLHHPLTTWRVIVDAMNQAGRQRPAHGNFSPEAGYPPYRETTTFVYWSGLKRWLFENHGVPYILCALALCLLAPAAAYLRRGVRGMSPLATLLAAFALYELLADSLGDVVDVTRHFFLFGAVLDCLLLCMIVELGARTGVSHRTAAEAQTTPNSPEHSELSRNL